VNVLRIFLLVGLCLGGWISRAKGEAPGFQTSAAASVLVCGGSMMSGDRFADSVLASMRAHYAGRTAIALVLHASHPTERDAMELRLQKAFAHLLGAAVKAESLHRRDAAGAKELLRTADAFFVGGGETFVLLGELQRTGELELIRARVLVGVPYGGSSAGANVAGLRIGTTNDFPTAEVVSREALAIFPTVINPHHPAATPAEKAEFAARVGKLKTYLKFNPQEIVLALGNTSIARLHGGRVMLTVGQGWVYQASGTRELVAGEWMAELAR
jgi:dipeptidase E